MHKTDSRLIDDMGGTVAVATECEVSSQAVSKWRKYGIPNSRRKYLRLRFPDIFIKYDLVGCQRKAS
jgi:hypothetical protein